MQVHFSSAVLCPSLLPYRLLMTTASPPEVLLKEEFLLLPEDQTVTEQSQHGEQQGEQSSVQR
ncbi:hypothetical protein F7725_011457 [Dissostichus mawsoni]|uniref:Uncharacterized protein n=1 Tax=Dissostichus mawsoni TaxID=36200 RepID=A0A7J5Z994_DISMA|nr:hypothetical protein F7725_011457 [Dissostichus mawsoni]